MNQRTAAITSILLSLKHNTREILAFVIVPIKRAMATLTSWGLLEI